MRTWNLATTQLNVWKRTSNCRHCWCQNLLPNTSLSEFSPPILAIKISSIKYREWVWENKEYMSVKNDTFTYAEKLQQSWNFVDKSYISLIIILMLPSSCHRSATNSFLQSFCPLFYVCPVRNAFASLYYPTNTNWRVLLLLSNKIALFYWVI